MGSSGRPSRSWRRLRARQARRGSDSFLRTLTLTRTDQNTSIVQPRSVTPHLPSSQPWISSIQSESKVSLCIISNTKSRQYLTTILAITKIQKNPISILVHRRYPDWLHLVFQLHGCVSQCNQTQGYQYMAIF